MLLPREPANDNFVHLVEVGPRDGLQNIPDIVRTTVKIELVKRLAAAGFPTVEATSFVSPKWTPQLADGHQVLQGIKPLIDQNCTQFPVLVPNARGMAMATANGARDIAVFVSATEGFSRKNTNCSVAEALARARVVAQKAQEFNLRLRGFVRSVLSVRLDR
jgi:hydroxymethylglutaryl-CoA lyase